MSEKIPFKVSTSMKTIIGKELVTNPKIAIFELVKNSYDARAPNVWIIFGGLKDKANPRITIVDNGAGMSKADLTDKWLFVGYSEKREREGKRRVSIGEEGRRSRMYAGAKGIGRFSCDTLGGGLVMHTRKKGERRIHRLEVDWREFEEDQTKQFQKVSASYSTERETAVEGFNLAKMRCGTILEITRLRDDWDIAKLRELRRYLERLVNPVDGRRRGEEFSIEVRAEEFLEEDQAAERSGGKEPVVNGIVGNFVFEKLRIKTTYVESHVDRGRITTRLTDKDKLVFDLSEKNVYSRLRGVDVRIFYLNSSAKTLFTKAMGLPARKYGSIFLYKNEFRIHPYGDEGDDWLGLEHRLGQGYRRYLSKRDIIGSVIIRGRQRDFKEVSSRDGGVIKNDAYQQLIDYIITKAFRRLERYVTGVIEWDTQSVIGTEDREKIEAMSVDLVTKLVEGTKGPDATITVGPAVLQMVDDRVAERYPEILQNLVFLRQHVPGDAQQAALDRAIRSTRTVLARSEREREDLASKLVAKEQQVLFLEKSLSPEQELLQSHLHSVKIAARNMLPEIRQLLSWAKSNKAPQEVIDSLDGCSIEARKILVLSKMANLANFDLAEEELDADIVGYVKQYLQHFGKTPKDVLQPIRFVNDQLVHRAVFKPISLAIVIDNLLDNSRKNNATEVAVSFEKSEGGFHTFFGDNGPGVEPEARPHIFSMGYSTTGGSGLGLFESRKIMESLHGTISFIGNGKRGLGSGACFELVIP